MEIKPFDSANIDTVAQMATEMLCKEIAVSAPFTSQLVRNWFYTPGLALQACDHDGLQAVAFAAMPHDTCNNDDWIDELLLGIGHHEKQKILNCVAHMRRTDEQMLKLMPPHAAIFSLFLSRKRGFGKPLMNALIDMLQRNGIKWIYLLTDTHCSWQFFSHNAFELVKVLHAPHNFSDDPNYRCLMFRKLINEN